MLWFSIFLKKILSKQIFCIMAFIRPFIHCAHSALIVPIRWTSCLSISKNLSYSFSSSFATETFGPVTITKVLSDHSSTGRRCEVAEEEEKEDTKSRRENIWKSACNERIRTCSLETDCGVTHHFRSLPPTLTLSALVVTASLFETSVCYIFFGYTK